MICRTCGRALEAGSRFCPACGTPIETACRSCGANLAADARFCVACGTTIAAGALQRRWIEAVTGEPAAASQTLRAVADDFEAIGYRLPAADCHADAALLARRANQDPGADEAAASRLYASCGAVPALGELPETRWVGSEMTEAQTFNARA